MITPGRIAARFFGTAAGLFLGRALFKWILDLHGAWEWAPIVAFALVGCVLGIASEIEGRRTAQPAGSTAPRQMSLPDRRSAVVIGGRRSPGCCRSTHATPTRSQARSR